MRRVSRSLVPPTPALLTHNKRSRSKLDDDVTNPTYLFNELGTGYRMAIGLFYLKAKSSLQSRGWHPPSAGNPRLRLLDDAVPAGIPSSPAVRSPVPTLHSDSSSSRPLRAAHTPISCRLPTPILRCMA